MPLEIPPDLKKISPYIRRAEELDKDKSSPESRLVAYYCRQYAVHVGIPLSGSSAQAKKCLGELLEQLEAEKPAMDNFTRDEAAFLCRMFANRVFDRANEEDLMGNAGKNTAKTFYAASTFLQILEQFSDDNDTSEEHAEDRKRIVYSKWKSTDILKAIKEGRRPTPGGYGEDEEDEDVDTADDASAKLATEAAVSDDDNQVEAMGLPPTAPSAPLIPPPQPETQPENDEAPIHVYVPPDEEDNEEIKKEEQKEAGKETEVGPPPAYPGKVTDDGDNYQPDRAKVTFDIPSPAPAPVAPPPVAPLAPPSMAAPIAPPVQTTTGLFASGGKRGKVTKAQLADAVELTRFALAALEDKDTELGAERLQQALQVLGK